MAKGYRKGLQRGQIGKGESIIYIEVTPPKTNMDTQNDGLENISV